MTTWLTAWRSALCHLPYRLPKYSATIVPASRTVATSSLVPSDVSGTCDRHAVHAERRRVRSVAENEIVRGRDLAIHVFEVTGDCDLADGISELAVFDPEAGGAA